MDKQRSKFGAITPLVQYVKQCLSMQKKFKYW